MTRVIRPVGKVSAALSHHGYRQQAIILVDDKPLPHVAVLSRKVGNKVKFEGHWIDTNGELHKTNAFVDMKKAATAILVKRDAALLTDEVAKQVAKPAPKTAAAKRAARRQQRHSSTPTPQSAGAMIQCKGCGTRHADDTLCPE